MLLKVLALEKQRASPISRIIMTVIKNVLHQKKKGREKIIST